MLKEVNQVYESTITLYKMRFNDDIDKQPFRMTPMMSPMVIQINTNKVKTVMIRKELKINQKKAKV